MISTAVKATAAVLATGALALVGAGSASAETIAPTTTPGASVAQPWRGDFCDDRRNQWNRACERHDTWRWEGQRWDGHRWQGGHWQHYRFNGHRWDRR